MINQPQSPQPDDDSLSDSFFQELAAVLDQPTAMPNHPPTLDNQSLNHEDELSESFIYALTQYIDQPGIEQSGIGQGQPTAPTEPAFETEPTELTEPVVQFGRRSTDLPAMINRNAVIQTPAEAAASQSWKNKLADYYRSASVRVDVNRLNRLNNLVAELMIQENGVLLQSQQLQGTIQSVSQRFQRFTQILHRLDEWVAQSQKGLAKLDEQTIATHRLSPEFDPLQMDSYSPLYTIAQDAVEEIAQIGEVIQDMTLLDQRLHETYRHRQQTLKQVHQGLLQTQMLPVADVVQRFPRMIRDLSSQHHKRVRLRMVGTNTLMEKAILDKLMDPLVHLLRNAFDHGIEKPLVRQSNGKPVEGTIELRVFQRGNQTHIELRDDGRGIDPEMIRKKIVERKLVTADEATNLSQEALYDYIFYPGFSTAAQVTQLSGRGVGMDAVRSQVRQLKGTITVKSTVSKGTVFTLKFPLTLTVANLLVFQIQSLIFAVPTNTIGELVDATFADLETIGTKLWFNWQGKQVPIYPAHAFSQYYPLPQKVQAFPAVPLPRTEGMTMLIVSTDRGEIGIPIDQILQEQELVVKPFGALIPPPDYLYGCTILGDGTLVPILDGAALLRRWQKTDWDMALAEVEAVNRQSPVRSGLGSANPPLILVVDDSLTARQFVVMTLEKEGYQVLQARDGREAMLQLQQSPQIQAVFCDVEMPRMNGFEFLEHCRQYPETAGLPILMLTSRSGDKHRDKAYALGATEYLTKPYLEQDLLAALAECLVQ
jgi:two-component system, chemotaxis family, sensor histidine kinase and response regulator PixL